MTVIVEDGIYERLVGKTIRHIGLESGIDSIGAQDEVKNFDGFGGPPLGVYSRKEVETAKSVYPFFSNDKVCASLGCSTNHIGNYIPNVFGLRKVQPDEFYSQEQAAEFLPEPIKGNIADLATLSHSLDGRHLDMVLGRAVLEFAVSRYFARHEDEKCRKLADTYLSQAWRGFFNYFSSF